MHSVDWSEVQGLYVVGELVRFPGNDSEGGISEVAFLSQNPITTDEEEKARRVDESKEECNKAWKQAMPVRPNRAFSAHHHGQLAQILREVRIGLQIYRQGGRSGV